MAMTNTADIIYYNIQTPEWEPHVRIVRRLDPRTGLYKLTGCIRKGDERKLASLYVVVTVLRAGHIDLCSSVMLSYIVVCVV